MPHASAERELAFAAGLTDRLIHACDELIASHALFDGEREMRMTLDEREDETIDQLANLPLWADDEEKIPLASVANLEIMPGMRQIQRDDRLTCAISW